MLRFSQRSLVHSRDPALLVSCSVRLVLQTRECSECAIFAILMVYRVSI